MTTSIPNTITNKDSKPTENTNFCFTHYEAYAAGELFEKINLICIIFQSQSLHNEWKILFFFKKQYHE